MKLRDDFYKVLDSSIGVDEFFTTILLNPKHIVYSGHFPGYPVTPGVIQLQIVHELLEHYFGIKFKLRTMAQCKFLKVLNPNETSQLTIHIRFSRIEELLHIKAWGKNGADTFFKLNSIYQYS